METWAGQSTFQYTGSVAEGTTIIYGNGHSARISSGQYSSLLAHFKGRTVPCGTSRTDPPPGSLGAWLQSNVSPTAYASYVGKILVVEGYAQKRGHDIQFK